MKYKKPILHAANINKNRIYFTISIPFDKSDTTVTSSASLSIRKDKYLVLNHDDFYKAFRYAFPDYLESIRRKLNDYIHNEITSTTS